MRKLTRFSFRRPQASALISGSEAYPDIMGRAEFFETQYGVIVSAQVSGLPKGEKCNEPIFGFHIHGGENCSGNTIDPFADAGTHYDPNDCPHPYHAGDMPPLFGADGNAFLIFLTNRFTIPQIMGKTIIIHSSPDDFTTQPSGNAGTKIACGIIE